MNSPNILFLDIETVPLEIRTWGRYQQDAIEVMKEWYIICCGIKWMGHPTKVFSLPDYQLYKKDPQSDRELVKMIWDEMNKADIVIAHNGDDFDIKKLNSRFLYYKLKPPAPYKTVDTLKIMRRKFANSSNRLNDVAEFMGLGRKIDTGGFKLWKGCIAGDKSSWKKMVAYNKRDVDLLEKVYKQLIPWHSTHPNMGMYTDKIVCSNCGGSQIQSRGFAFSKTTKYKRLQCMQCGAWMRDTINLRESKPLVGI